MDRLQQLCVQGQDCLLATRYLEAEALFTEAESLALGSRDWDSLSRLYMPLQEVRRQRRQRAGEGTVALNKIAHTAADQLDAEQILSQYPQGQLLIAGFGTLSPAIHARRIAQDLGLYVDVFLGATYWVNGKVAVAIVPTEEVAVPEDGEYSIDELTRLLPPHSLIVPANEFGTADLPGSPQTFALTMALFERLHRPFLASADATTPPELRIEAYRNTIVVDYACELAHQRLSDTARELSRRKA